MEPRPTSQAGCHDGAGGQEGLTLLEIVCVLAMMALLAAILLPRMPGGTSRSQLEAYAIEAASMLSWTATPPCFVTFGFPPVSTRRRD